jgi:hypothetical protein
MADLRQEVLTLRLVGEISPTKIKIRELGPILYNYERALKGIIASGTKEFVSEKDYYLTLNAVTSDSVGYVITGFSPNGEFTPALTKLGEVIRQRDFRDLNKEATESVDKITGWLRTHKCDAELYCNGSLITTIPRSLKVAELEYFVKEYSTLHGIIIDVGKIKPRVEIKLIDGETLFFDLTKEQAIDLGKYLYRKITLIGEANIHPKTYKIDSFKLEEYVILNDEPYVKKFEKLGEIIGKAWSDIDDPVEYLNLNG